MRTEIDRMSQKFVLFSVGLICRNYFEWHFNEVILTASLPFSNCRSNAEHPVFNETLPVEVSLFNGLLRCSKPFANVRRGKGYYFFFKNVLKASPIGFPFLKMVLPSHLSVRRLSLPFALGRRRCLLAGCTKQLQRITEKSWRVKVNTRSSVEISFEPNICYGGRMMLYFGFPIFTIVERHLSFAVCIFRLPFLHPTTFTRTPNRQGPNFLRRSSGKTNLATLSWRKNNNLTAQARRSVKRSSFVPRAKRKQEVNDD